MGNRILDVSKMNISFINPDGSEKVILVDGSFHVDSGEIVLIIGDNGAGKSSIFRSLVRDDSKQTLFKKLRATFKKKNKTKYINERLMLFEGVNVDIGLKDESGKNLQDWFRSSIGYVEQEDPQDKFFERKIGSLVYDYASASAYFAKTSEDDIWEEIKKTYSSLKCEEYHNGKLLDAVQKDCSGGEKRMASILQALARTKSKLFILDEPLNNLDSKHARYLNDYLIDLTNPALNPDPPGVLIITHCQMFQKVSRAYQLENGTIRELKENEYKPKSCFGKCIDAEGHYCKKGE